jgi:UPF0716 protein FxsA
VRLFPIPLLILLYLAIELASLIIVGREIGVLATIALIFATAALGAVLLRVQGFGILTRIRGELDAGRVPGREMAHGVMIMIAGILLMIPGFISDILGLFLFIPVFRDASWALVSRRIRFVSATMGGGSWRRREQRPTIDLDAEDYARESDEDQTLLPPERTRPPADRN